MPFQPTVKKRKLKGPNLHARMVERPNVTLAESETTFYNRRLDGFQLTETEGHPFRGSYHGKDVGGGFRTVRDTTEFLGSSAHLQFDKATADAIKPKGIQRTFDGNITPVVTPDSSHAWTPDPQSLSFNSDLDTKGTEAIALCNPLNPVGDAATFLTESLGERIPTLPGVRLWKSRTKALLGLGEEFLNAEFGYLPMLREISDFRDAVKSATQTMQQFERDAGKLVRRSWYFPTEKHETRKLIASESVPLFGGESQFPGEAFIGKGKMPVGRAVEIKQVQRKVWFKGAFTYPIPHQSDSWRGMVENASGLNATNIALGSNITPETLWELTPWSWALDWFSNAQEVVQNLQAFKLQGLVMPYGYIMDEESTKTTYTWEPEPGLIQTTALTVSPIVRTRTTKMRKQASPFGFGLEWKDLSPLQLAILAALGITLAL